MSNLVWLITGCSTQGFGFNLAVIALKQGHRVIASSRNPSKSLNLVSQVTELGGKWVALDVCDLDVSKTLDEATAIYGRIDILVNNAGYALLGAFETFSEEQCRAQMETNFFGPMRLVRHLIPAMRERKSGVIVNVSSTAGIEARATRSLYSGSKFALEGFSEALHAEVASLGIRVLIVEPGAFRTPFSAGVVPPAKPLPSEYEGTITAQMVDYMASFSDPSTIPGDVVKGSQAIFDVVTKTGQGEGLENYVRLPLGIDGSKRWDIKLAALKANLDGTEKIWSKTDH